MTIEAKLLAAVRELHAIDPRTVAVLSRTAAGITSDLRLAQAAPGLLDAVQRFRTMALRFQRHGVRDARGVARPDYRPSTGVSSVLFEEDTPDRW